jgi:hypothetical protein
MVTPRRPDYLGRHHQNGGECETALVYRHLDRSNMQGLAGDRRTGGEKANGGETKLRNVT